MVMEIQMVTFTPPNMVLDTNTSSPGYVSKGSYIISWISSWILLPDIDNVMETKSHVYTPNMALATKELSPGLQTNCMTES